MLGMIQRGANRTVVDAPIAAAAAALVLIKLRNYPLLLLTATLTKRTTAPSSSPMVLFAQMMFADQVYRTRLCSFFT
jgi:hypothetical protein